MTSWLGKKQQEFDEKWIKKEKEIWKNKFRNLSTEELNAKLQNLETHKPMGLKTQLLLGSWGSATHIDDRTVEAMKRAIKELLNIYP